MSEIEEQVMGAEGITASDLMKKEFPEPRWAIPGILPEGLNMLAGKPKKGKSIMALNLGLSISLGGLALGKIPVEQGAVMYLALEDTERRLQGRLRQMLYTDPAPENLFLYTKWPRMDAGGLELLETRISEIPNIRLVIIDTLHKFRKPARSNGNLYAEDYDTVCQIKDVADRLGVCILLIHHQRKSEAEDIFDTMSGSLGLTGGTDGNLVMESNKGNTILHITGRDVEEVELAIELDGRMLAWRLLGERSEVKSTHDQQRAYDVLKESRDALSPKEIAEISGLKVGTVKKILARFMEDQSVEKTAYGKYTIKENEF